MLSTNNFALAPPSYTDLNTSNRSLYPDIGFIKQPPIPSAPENIYQQPQPELNFLIPPPLTTTTNQPRAFRNKLCGCCNDRRECCFAFWCQICYHVNLFTKANENCCSCFCGGLVPLRTKIRTERNIEGSICKDCCVVNFCLFCALVQMGQELKPTNQLEITIFR